MTEGDWKRLMSAWKQQEAERKLLGLPPPKSVPIPKNPHRSKAAARRRWNASINLPLEIL